MHFALAPIGVLRGFDSYSLRKGGVLFLAPSLLLWLAIGMTTTAKSRWSRGVGVLLVVFYFYSGIASLWKDRAGLDPVGELIPVFPYVATPLLFVLRAAVGPRDPRVTGAGA